LGPNALLIISLAGCTARCLLPEQMTTSASLFSANSLVVAKPIPLVRPGTYPLRDDDNRLFTPYPSFIIFI
jgi:hypothetical protein